MIEKERSPLHERRHFKIFVTVVEQKHFSRAAELLNLSQPGVSMHIRNLENEFGTIQRSPKHVQVTEAGNILYIHAKQMLSLRRSQTRN